MALKDQLDADLKAAMRDKATVRLSVVRMLKSAIKYREIELMKPLDDAGVLQAALRIVDPGLKYAEPSIGRVVTAPAVRGRGAGRALMVEGLARCDAAWPGQGVRISAQSHLART